MPKFNSPTELTDTLSAPLGDLISAVGRGVAEAQQALDAQTIANLKALYADDSNAELRRLGYQPTWYKIPEVTAEISMSLTVSGQASEKAGTQAGQQSNIKLYAAPIDASYSNKYDYDLKASSHLKFRIVPVPPSPQASEIKVVPDIVNKQYSEAIALLNDLEITWQLSDETAVPEETDTIQETMPSAGEIINAEQVVIIVLN
ncbi:MAG: PASTA domain-containing protein [Gammaproteobacteria bacterium]|nr:PASTA domain-containing protein [Gammaproteobacteria bacterium]